MSDRPLGNKVSSVNTITTTLTTVAEYPNGGKYVGVVHLGATPERIERNESKYIEMPASDSLRTLFFERNKNSPGVLLTEEMPGGQEVEGIYLGWKECRALTDFLIECLMEHEEEQVDG